jgi:YggT family protein
MVLDFLRDVCEPYLRLFRRLIPSFGGIDFTPMIAIFVLVIVDRIVVNAIGG